MKKKDYLLYFSSITANLVFITTGCIGAWNSPTIPKLLSNNTEINPFGKPITIIQQSVILGVSPFGSVLGVMLIGKIPDIIGRKKSLICLQMIVLLSLVGLAFASNFYVYVVVTTVLALSNSASDVVAPIYTAEVAQNNNRGKLGSVCSLGMAIGQFLVYLTGPVTTMLQFSLVCSIPTIAFLILSIFIPESPVFRLKSQKTDVLLNPRKADNCIEEENIEKVNFLDIFKTRSGKKAFILILVVRALNVLTGIYIILSFMGTLLKDSSSTVSGSTIAAMVTVGKMICSIITYNLIERLGRRFHLLIGSSGSGTALLILGLHFYFKENNYILPEYLRLLPVFAVGLYIFTYSFGLSSVSYLAISELLPNEYRAVGISVCFTLVAIVSIMITFTYPIVVRYLGTYYAFFTFSLISYSGFIFIYKFLPETKGKSFIEIKKLLDL